MARSTRKQPDDEGLDISLGRRLYRIFLLSILFGVLWVKAYLWTAFLLALMLYFLDSFLPILAVAMQQAERAPAPPPAPELPSEPELPSRPDRSRWKWTPKDAP